MKKIIGALALVLLFVQLTVFAAINADIPIPKGWSQIDMSSKISVNTDGLHHNVSTFFLDVAQIESIWGVYEEANVKKWCTFKGSFTNIPSCAAGYALSNKIWVYATDQTIVCKELGKVYNVTYNSCEIAGLDDSGGTSNSLNDLFNNLPSDDAL